MPPTFFVDMIERRVDRIEGQPNPVERQIITRFYTEFDPDPEKIMDRLFEPADGDGLPSIFYELEGLDNEMYKILPSASNIKPLSISIDPGNWGDRVDWTVQWEVIGETQPPITILGLTIYDWRITTTDGQEVDEHLFGHRIFGTSQDSAGAFTHSRIKKTITNYTGKVVGQINYGAVRSQIASNTSVIGFDYSYNPITEITEVSITLTASESEDNVL